MLKSKRASGEDVKYKNINCELNDRELVNIALQVATGMQHLETKKVSAAYNGMTEHLGFEKIVANIISYQ